VEPFGPFFSSAGPDKDASTPARTPGNILLDFGIGNFRIRA